MQKILYLITQSEFGGAQRYIFDLADNLKSEFEIYIASGNENNQTELIEKLNEKSIKYYKIKHLKRAISPIKDILALAEIIKLIKKIKPDIIHLNSSKISILGSLAFLITKINPYNSKFKIQNSKLIYTAHGWVFNEPMSIWKKLFYKYAEKFTARFKNKIICVSEFDYQTALKEKVCSPEKLITIHNGLEVINFLPRDEARHILLSETHPVILEGAKNERLIESQDSIAFGSRMTNSLLIGSVGHLYKTKGYKYLIGAIKILVTDHQLPIVAVIIGEGNERKNLETLIQKNNLEKNVLLVGEKENASELLSAFDIYVCSSVKEGFPYSILEAMSAELPIVSTRVGGIPEMIENKKNGLLVESQNADDLAEKIKILINNKTDQEKYSANAKTKVAEEFSLEKMIAETKKLYLN